MYHCNLTLKHSEGGCPLTMEHSVKRNSTLFTYKGLEFLYFEQELHNRPTHLQQAEILKYSALVFSAILILFCHKSRYKY
jgi:hypothetical protein